MSQPAKVVPLAMTLTLAIVGGAVFYLLSLPLPWMVGAMAATTLGAVLKLPMAVPVRLRSATMVILGLMLGTGFSPDVPGRLLQWWPGLAALAVYLVIVVVAGNWWYRRKLTLDPPTAYYAAVPGGLGEMIALTINAKGDEGVVSIMHTLRIMVVAVLVPWSIRLYEGLPLTSTPGAAHLLDLSLVDYGFLGLGAASGMLLGRLLRMPAYLLVGPMITSAFLSMMGFTQAHTPIEMIIAAQVILGGAVGARLAFLRPALVKRCLWVAFVFVLPMVGLAALMALGVSDLAGFDYLALLLALIPGGLGEMTLIALAMNIDVPFVVTHHMTRIFLVMLIAPLAFRWLNSYQNKRALKSSPRL